MNERRRKTTEPAADVASSESKQIRGKYAGESGILHHLFWGLLASAGLLALKIVFVEELKFGEGFERAAYASIQNLLRSDADSVAVIDISKLNSPPVKIDAPTPTGTFEVPWVTPPLKLEEIIEAVENCEPCAIGIDINFAPYAASGCAFLTPEHEDFHIFCMKCKNVYTGVYAATDMDRRLPELLLSDRRFKAACVVLICKPEETPREDTRLMPPALHDGVPTMSAALAEAFLTSQHVPNAVEQVEARMSPSRFATPVIDYSGLNTILMGRTVEPSEIGKNRGLFKGKIVLIGGAKTGLVSDTFTVEGHQGPVPGVDIYACAVDTLLHSPVLRELTTTGRVVVDGGLSLALLGSFGLALWLLRGRTLRKSAVPRLQKWCTGIVAALVIGVGVFAVGYTRIMWDDWIFVLPAILFHSTAEGFAKGLWGRLRGGFERSIVRPR